MYNKLVANLIEKIKKLDFDFTEEEKQIIILDEKISLLLIQTLINNPSVFTKFYNIEINYEAINLLSNEEKNKLLLLFLNTQLYVFHDIDMTNCLATASFLGIDASEIVNNCFEKVLSDHNYTIEEKDKVTIDYKALELLLNYKRYDLIEKCYVVRDSDDQEYAKNIIDRFFNEYPFDKLKRPYIILSMKELIDNERLTIKELNEKLNSKHTFRNNHDDKSITLIKNEIINRIYNAESLEDLEDDISWYNFLSSLSEEERKNFFNECVKKGYYIKEMFIGSFSFDFKYDIESLFIRFHDDIMNNRKIHYILLEKVLEYGYDFSEEEINTIIKNINENNPKYNEFLTTVKYNMDQLPIRIIKAMINAGKLKFVRNFSYTLNDEYYELFLELLKKYPKLNIERLSNKDINLEILTLLIKNKRYNDIEDILYSKDDISELIDVINKQIGEDYTFAKRLLNYKDLITIPKFVNSYLENEKLFFILLDKIIHNDDNQKYIDFYSHENYQKVKMYLVKRYNLNLTHLDLLEQAFGPTIIKYASSENISDIINSDDETFNRIINLFSEKNYTMVDLESSYEAIIQHTFTLEKNDVINFFTNFKTALQNEDLEQINVFKNILSSKLNIQIINKIGNKYGLEVNTTNELLDIVISKYYILEERQKSLDILKDITDRYKLLEFKDFRNNYHLYECHKELKDLYNNIVNTLLNNQSYELYSLERIIAKEMDDGVLRKLKKYSYFLTFNFEDEDYLTLLNFLFQNVEMNIHKEESLQLIKEIVDYYTEKITKKVQEHSSIGDDLSLPYTLDEKACDRYFDRYIIEHMFSLYIDQNHKSKFSDLVFNKLKEKGLSDILIIDLYKYYFNKNSELSTPIDIVQQNMKIFITTTLALAKNNNLYYRLNLPLSTQKQAILNDADKNLKIKRNYIVDKSSIDIYKVLSEINVKQAQKLFENKNAYQILQKIMNRRKPHLLPDSIFRMLKRESSQLEFEYSYLAGFICYFEKIYEETIKILLSVNGSYTEEDLILGLVSLINYSNVYGGVSGVYSQILGKEDARLIKSNPLPNSNNIKPSIRLKKAVSLTPDLFRRTTVTIPTFSETISFNNGNKEKKIDAIVGNFTNSCNLTHGERTGACMRIYGAGDTLLKFCLQNENGFHIRFENPSNHNYISRVSGFRNGNTVFLNELRCSNDPQNYTDYDLECALEEVSKKLIEISKDSSYPIDNVVVHREYATKHSPKKEVNLGVNNIKKDLPDFYTDVGSYVILLATSSDESFVPVNFDKNNMPHYLVSRSRVIVSSDLEVISSMINRVSAVKKLLNGEEYEYLEPIIFDKNIIYAAANDDWYVYVDEDLEIHYEAIDIDQRALTEMQPYLEYAKSLSKEREASL